MFKRYNFYSHRSQKVVGVLDYTLCAALIQAATQAGPVIYIGSNAVTDPPMEYKSNEKGEDIPVQRSLFRDDGE